MIPFDVQPTAGQPGGSSLLDEILRRVRVTLQSLARVVTNDHLVSAAIATTDTQVFHGLGALPLTIEVVGLNADAAVWESTTVNSQRDRYVLLRASAPVTATLRFT